MPRLRIFQIDAFTRAVFKGNPAAICPLDAWLDDATMQAIAAENNLAETAFFVPDGEDYQIRWFTPTMEVDLCGHATLASAHVVFAHLAPWRTVVTFASRSGPLVVRRDGERLAMDFPTLPPINCPNPPVALGVALGRQPAQVLAIATKFFAVFACEADVAALRPDLALLATLHPRGVAATAPGDCADFVSRFFAPSRGIPEDPVNGSSHASLVPYWAGRLGRAVLHARQISVRGGDLYCELRGDRVWLAGYTAPYLEGTITIG